MCRWASISSRNIQTTSQNELLDAWVEMSHLAPKKTHPKFRPWAERWQGGMGEERQGFFLAVLVGADGLAPPWDPPAGTTQDFNAQQFHTQLGKMVIIIYNFIYIKKYRLHLIKIPNYHNSLPSQREHLPPGLVPAAGTQTQTRHNSLPQNIFSRSSIASEFLLSHETWKAGFPLTSNLFLWNSDQAKRSPPGDSVSVTGGGFSVDGGTGGNFFLLLTPGPFDLTKFCAFSSKAQVQKVLTAHPVGNCGSLAEQGKW